MASILNHEHEADPRSPCMACWGLGVDAEEARKLAGRHSARCSFNRSGTCTCGANLPAPGSARRHDVPGCPRCDREPTVFHPAHDASPRCDSGGREHCSCDTCF